MRIFSDMDLCELLGSGMKKIMRVYSKEIFDISEHFIAVCFPYNKEALTVLNEQSSGGVNSGVIPLSENALLVLKILKIDGTLTQKQIADQSKLSIRSVQRAIKELRDNKIIKREGSDKNGRCILSQETH
jgi:predicted HTH transcriptional regulator